MSEAFPYFQIRGSGCSLFIDAGDGRPLGGKHYRGYHIALARAHHLENAARIAHRVKDRACLCCGTSFTSTGAHHRLCDTCRGLA